MAKSVKKKTTRTVTRPRKNKFGVVMTPRIRLFLLLCFLFGFAVVALIALGVRW